MTYFLIKAEARIFEEGGTNVLDLDTLDIEKFKIITPEELELLKDCLLGKEKNKAQYRAELLKKLEAF